jgi:hypothetical protein
VREENPLVALPLFPLSMAAVVAGRPPGRRRPSPPLPLTGCELEEEEGLLAENPLPSFIFPKAPYPYSLSLSLFPSI